MPHNYVTSREKHTQTNIAFSHGNKATTGLYEYNCRINFVHVEIKQHCLTSKKQIEWFKFM